MWKEGDLEDDKISIKVENKIFVCNRTTLSLHSSYFNAMFHGNFVEKDKKEITLQSVKITAFSNILKCIEHGEINTNFENVLDLDTFEIIECANMLQFEEIVKMLYIYSLPELNIDTCLKTWEACELYDIHPMLEQAKFKAYKEFHQVIKTNYFKKLIPKQLHAYLSNTFIYCDNEMEIFKAGMYWWSEYSKIQKNITDEKKTKYLLLVLSCIDFKSINIKDIEKMLNHREINVNKKIKSILNELCSLLSILQYQNNSTDLTYEEMNCDIEICEETKRLYSNSRREKKLLKCIVTSELNNGVNFPNFRTMNVSYYDEKSKTLKKLFNNYSNFQKNYVYLLKGSKLIPFNENLLLISGNCLRQRIQNTEIWIYYTDKDKWELYCKVPDIPSCSSILQSNNELFIARKNGISRVVLTQFCYIDLKSRVTNSYIKRHPLNIEYKLRFCVYKNGLLFLSVDNSCAYLFVRENSYCSYKKLLVQRKSNIEQEFPDNIIFFSIENTIYIKDVNDTMLYEFILDLEHNELREKKITKLQATKAMPEEKFNYILDKNKLYMFTKVEEQNFDNETFLKFHHLELHCLNITSKTMERLIEIKNENNQLWHTHRGCFQFSHYKAIEFNSRISKYIL